MSVDVLAVLRAARDSVPADQLIAYCDAVATVADMIEVLDNIGGLSRALRVGGPDPMDLRGLSDALSEAVDAANAAVSRAQGGAR